MRSALKVRKKKKTFLSHQRNLDKLLFFSHFRKSQTIYLSKTNHGIEKKKNSFNKSNIPGL